jgi:hypothetical protein
LRIPRQSENATALAKWLKDIEATPVGQEFEGIPGGLVTKVFHSSLQGIDERGFDPKSQMEGGWNATFSILVRDIENSDGGSCLNTLVPSSQSLNRPNSYPILSNILSYVLFEP